MSDLKFEDCLVRLEQIVSALESGNLPLEESLKVFEEGVALARRCAQYLGEAERRIEILAKDEAGKPGTKTFSEWGPRSERGATSTRPATLVRAPRSSTRRLSASC